MNIVEDLRGFEIDHEPDGWPAVRMRQISALCDEVERLRAFAQAVMECWPMGDLDGGTLQDAAEKHGLLRPETRHEPCGEGCACAEYALPVEFADGVTCYRKTPLLTGKTHNAEVRGASRLAGEASSTEGATSTDVLGAGRSGKD